MPIDPTMPPVDPDLKSILAKSSGESLVEHTWHVLCRLADQRRLRPTLTLELGQPRFWHYAYWGTFLHDFGKAASGFQDVMKGKKRHWGYRHEALSLAFVEWLFPLDHPDRVPVIALIATHHRDAADIWKHYSSAQDNAQDVIDQLQPENVRRLYNWLAGSGWTWAQALGFAGDTEAPTLPDFETAKARITAKAIHRAASALRQYTTPLAFRADAAEALRGTLLRGLILTADHAGSALESPFPAATVKGDLIVKMLGERQLFPHQQAAADAPAGSMLLISPTSSGKTEAALLWLARQQQHDGHPGGRIFYTLPYQASMNAMWKRLLNLFPDPDTVGLQHGRMLQTLYYHTLAKDPEADPTAFARQQKALANLHKFPINLISPYQMLKVPYQLKGFEALLTHFYGGRFILDEIHAYDPERMALILRMIGFLQATCQARFFIMTATLPPHVRAALHAVLPDLQTVEATPETFRRFQRHRLHVLPGELLSPPVLDRILDDAAADKSVLICCNMVRRAFEVYETIQSALTARYPGGDFDVILLHSRFNGRDRAEKERRIIEQTGVDARTRKRTIVIATQVVEVSLNIDMDTLYSEAAPLEALLQRFGRVNRGHPPGPPLADVYVVSEQPPAVSYIYRPALIASTLKRLTDANNTDIDEGQVGEWLRQVYEGEALIDWQQRYEDSYQQFETQVFNALKPFDSSGLDDLFYQMFDGLDVLPQGFFDEYARLIEAGEYIAASSLLVPVAWRDYRRLKQNGKTWEDKLQSDHYLRVVNVTYDPEKGLDLAGGFENSTPMEAD